jgi:hypothetical protein
LVLLNGRSLCKLRDGETALRCQSCGCALDARNDEAWSYRGARSLLLAGSGGSGGPLARCAADVVGLGRNRGENAEVRSRITGLSGGPGLQRHCRCNVAHAAMRTARMRLGRQRRRDGSSCGGGEA